MQPGLQQLPSAARASTGDGSAGQVGFVRADLKETLLGIQFPHHFFHCNYSFYDHGQLTSDTSDTFCVVTEL